MVCKLLKSLYRLKQARRAWYKALTDYLHGEGFEALQCEPCVFVKMVGMAAFAVIAIYVDDLVLIAIEQAVVKTIKAMILRGFRAKELGSINSLLEVSITRVHARRKMWLSQPQQIQTIVDKFDLTHAHPSLLPATSGSRLKKPAVVPRGDEMADIASKPYRQAVVSLVFLMLATRPDIAFAVQDVSRFLNSYRRPHWESVKGITKYVKGTSSYSLEFSGGSATLSAFADSDYTANVEDRKSISGYVTNIGSWALLQELGHQQHTTKMREDNQACIVIA
ncbi:hypothetical protein PybrP1_009714 [[Pythium] brassicae (nom. inval.)]|nr:hypothetical protein PybrP1_009714 [[Pythium] brassicae (nom. inval.)]